MGKNESQEQCEQQLFEEVCYDLDCRRTYTYKPGDRIHESETIPGLTFCSEACKWKYDFEVMKERKEKNEFFSKEKLKAVLRETDKDVVILDEEYEEELVGGRKPYSFEVPEFIATFGVLMLFLIALGHRPILSVVASLIFFISIYYAEA